MKPTIYILAILLTLWSGPSFAQNIEDYVPPPDTVNVKIESKEVIIEDAERDTKHLQFEVTLNNREFISNAPGLTLHLLVFGKYKLKKAPETLRMVLNQKATIDMEANKDVTWKSEIMYSGKGQPDHMNYGILYMGYLIVLTDKEGHEVDQVNTMRVFYSNYDRIKDVASGQDFPNPIYVRQ